MSDSSELSKSRPKPPDLHLPSQSNSHSINDSNSGSVKTNTSQESRSSHKSLTSLPKPKVTVLEQLSFASNVEGDISYSGTDDARIGTATTLDSTGASMITAVLRDLRDDIVHSQSAVYRPPGLNQLALVNGNADKAIAVIGGENVYVEGKSKFIPVPREKALSDSSDNRLWPYYTSKVSGCSPLDIAMIVQKVFAPISSICFGLLGGVALLQIIMVHQLGADPDRSFFLTAYSRLAELTPSLFHILLAVCVVSVLDRVPTRLDGAACPPAWLVTTVYGLTVVLTLSCAPYDDMFISYAHNRTQFQDRMKTQEMVSEWKVLNGSRCLLAFLGWLIFSLTSPPDLLLQHLQDVKGYIHSDP